MKRFSGLLPTAPIGAYLVALAAVIALPLIAFVIFLILRLEAQQRAILNTDTQDDARTIARAIDQELRDAVTTLKLISTSPDLDANDLQSFHNRTQVSLRGSSRYVLVADEKGQQLLNTRVDYGTPLPMLSDQETFTLARQTERIQVSNILFGNTSKRWVFNVILPLGGAARASGAAALILTQNAEDLQRLMSTDGLPKGWSVSVLDRRGNVVTATNAGAGEPSPIPPLTQELMTGNSGTIEDVNGMDRLMYGYARLLPWDWKIVVWGPISTAQATIVSTWRYFVIGSASFLTVGLLIAYLLGRQLRTPIRQIAEMAERIGRGEIVSPVETRIAEANQVAIALSNASFDRSEAEDRAHLVMRELVHRTKNIMTLIQAMMRQLARKETNINAFQSAIGERLQGLGRSIEMLAQEQWAGVPLMRVVALHLEAFAEAQSRVDVSGPDFVLRAEAVQNLGLILHELATNSVKYGALSVPEGRVSLSWRVDEATEGEPRIIIDWTEHNGPPVHEPATTGFGTTIIKRHAAAAFSGHVEVDYSHHGFRWTLTGPRRVFERCPTEAQKEEA
ncbi:sensor histidine kinase [Rhizobium sp. FKY42]|uniref:sensor histidine kinase n=1 Tax=Rhizobium sp. FKY42 TaxID=2562310 RepID=UPI0010C10DEA|nr:sensor histidine kinase [Rhizobium sp. FKY42]